jgi:hypothetical protein
MHTNASLNFTPHYREAPCFADQIALTRGMIILILSSLKLANTARKKFFHFACRIYKIAPAFQLHIFNINCFIKGE